MLGVINLKKQGILLCLLLIGFVLFIIIANNTPETEVHETTVDINNEEDEEYDDLTPLEDASAPSIATSSFNNTLSTPVAPLFAKQIHMVAIGDSITRGVGDETGNFGYVGRLKKTLNSSNQKITIENHGITGNRSDQLLDRLTGDDLVTDIQHADIVLITIGANDILQIFKQNFLDLHLDQFSDEKDEYRERLRNIVSTIKTTNDEASIYLIGFYNPFKTFFADIDEVDYIVDYWNNIGLEVTTEFDNVHYIPTKDLFTGPAESYLSDDNFHLNYDGYKIMTNRIIESLQKNEEIIYEQLELK